MIGSGDAAVSKRQAGERPERWMCVAAGEMGILEDVRRHHGDPGVQRQLAEAGFGNGGGEPWSSCFVRWALEQAGYAPCPERDNLAWLGWGERTTARYGAVAVFEDPDAEGPGHVGFYVGESPDCVYVLGGNIWERGRYAPGIGVRAFDRARLAGYRWPAEPRPTRTRSRVSPSRRPRWPRVASPASAMARGRRALRRGARGLRDQLAQAGQAAPQVLQGVFRELV